MIPPIIPPITCSCYSYASTYPAQNRLHKQSQPSLNISSSQTSPPPPGKRRKNHSIAYKPQTPSHAILLWDTQRLDRLPKIPTVAQQLPITHKPIEPAPTRGPRTLVRLTVHSCGSSTGKRARAPGFHRMENFPHIAGHVGMRRGAHVAL